ncbi:MAG TPA: hypothetical protein VHT96_06765 [Clostridia bacterium]|nr:hypothetical protein [Clostridia bacterium]
MKQSIKIGLAGSYKCDLIMYFSRILHSAGKKVAIIDASEEQFLSYCVPLVFDSDHMVTYRDIDVYYKARNEEDCVNFIRGDYDVILVDAGFNAKMYNYLAGCDYCIFVTDPEIHNVQRLSEFIGKYPGLKLLKPKAKAGDKPEVKSGEEAGTAAAIEAAKGSQIRVFRDMCPGKIDYKYLCSILDKPAAAQYIGEYVFQLDENDRRLGLYCQYDHIFKFTNLSKDYKLMFADMLETFFGMNKKQVKKSISRAERGR